MAWLDYVGQFGTSGSGDGQFNYPEYIAIDDSHIYVADTYNRRVQVFTLAGTYVGQFGSYGIGHSQFILPFGIAVYDLFIYVLDAYNFRCQKFNKNTYVYIDEFDTRLQYYTLNQTAIAVDANNLYITGNSGNGYAVEVVNKITYASVVNYGLRGSADGQIGIACYAIAVDDFYLYIADYYNFRVEILNKLTGAFVGKFGSYGTGEGQFVSEMRGIWVDANYIYVTNYGNNLFEIQIFNKATYAFVARFGPYSPSGENGTFNQAYAIVADLLNIYVTDIGNNRVQIFNNQRITMPIAPSLLTATCSGTPGYITLSWQDNSDNEDGFKIYKSTDGTNFSLAGSVSAGITTYAAAAVAGQNYWYRVTAYNEGFESDYVSGDGSLDTTFGTGGKVITSSVDSESVLNGNKVNIAIQTDGKTVIASQSSNGTNAPYYSVIVIRYNTDGSLDTSFGTGGIVRTYIELDCIAYDLAIQLDGKIVVVGTSYSYTDNNYSSIVIRYNTDGSLDTSFGTGGKVRLTVDYENFSFAVALQSDGKIVAAGLNNAYPSHFFLIRYNTDGSLDTSFGTGGIVSTSTLYYSQFNDVIIQSDGKIVAAGYEVVVNNPYDVDFALIRYNTDGSLDTGFGVGGKVRTNFTSYDDASAIALQTDGKIVVGGNDNDDSILARYNTDGSLDTSFGTGGKVITDFNGGWDAITSLIIQRDGKIVAAGYEDDVDLGYWAFALIRYNTNGSLDTTFGTGGKIANDPALFTDESYGFGSALQSDDKIVVAGWCNWSLTTHLYDIALVRYNMQATAISCFWDGWEVPNNPCNLALACSITPNAISLYWNDYSSNETGYNIYKSTDGVSFSLVTTTAANVTIHNVTGLTSGQDYWFRIKAFGSGGNSPYAHAGPINCSW